MDDFGVVTSPDSLRIERFFPGPIERVWSYLTDSDKRATWLAAGRMDLHVGGHVEHIFNNSQLTGHTDPAPPKYAQHEGESRMHGRITACEPPHLLSYTWGGTTQEASEVSFELATQGDGVLMVVTHRRLLKRDGMVSVAGGWHAHLGVLADRLANRPPASFWPAFARVEAEYEKRIPPC